MKRLVLASSAALTVGGLVGFVYGAIWGRPAKFWHGR